MSANSDATNSEPNLLEQVDQLEKEASPESAKQLQTLVWNEDKAASKAARTALYRLKLAGIEPELDGVNPPHTATVPPAQVITAYMTNVAGNGNQMLVFIEDEPYGGSPKFISFLLNHSDGLVALGSSKVSKRELGDALASLRNKEAGLLADAPVDYVRTVLVEAVRNTEACKRNPPKGFSELMHRIGEPIEVFDKPLIYSHYETEKIKSDLGIPRDAARLFDSEHFRGWMLEVESVSPWEEKYWETVQSNLSLDPVHLAKRGEGIVNEAADTLLVDGGMKALKRRLEEHAYALHINGETELAQSAFYHAVCLDDAATPHESPFVNAYTLRSIQIVMALKAEAEEEMEAEHQAVSGPDAPPIIIGK